MHAKRYLTLASVVALLTGLSAPVAHADPGTCKTEIQDGAGVGPDAPWASGNIIAVVAGDQKVTVDLQTFVGGQLLYRVTKPLHLRPYFPGGPPTPQQQQNVFRGGVGDYVSYYSLNLSDRFQACVARKLATVDYAAGT